MTTPRQDVKKCRKIRQQMSAQGQMRGTGIHIDVTEKAGKHYRRMAVISVGRSDFYDPAVAIRKTLLNLFNPDLAPRKVSQVDPTSVDYASPTQLSFRNHSHVSAKSFIRRMKLITGREKYLRCWRSSHAYGMFFLFPDRVVLQTWSCDHGFQVQQVPPDGINWNGKPSPETSSLPDKKKG
jgi:hypothetical protein